MQMHYPPMEQVGRSERCPEAHSRPEGHYLGRCHQEQDSARSLERRRGHQHQHEPVRNPHLGDIPGLARELHLTPMLAGFFCSIWFFSRVTTFLVLWLWSGWHYRLEWFVGGYLLLRA